MADNLAVTPGAGANIATDQATGDSSHIQLTKLCYSADGDRTHVTADADGLKVQIGKSIDLVTKPLAGQVWPVNDNGGVLSVDDNSASLTVDAPAATPVAVRLSTGSAFIDTIPVSDGGGTLSVDDGGSTLSVDGTVTATQGTAAAASGGWPVKVTDGTDTVGISTVSATKALKVDTVQSVLQQADKSTFTEGTTKMTPVGGVYNDTISADPTEDQAAALRITAKRGLHVNLRNVAGTELGTAADPVQVGLVNAAGAEIGTAADPVEVGLRNAAGTELATQTAPLLVAQAYGDQTRVTASVAITASQTGTTVYDPAAGKKFVITDVILALSVGGTLTLFDETDAAAGRLSDGTMPVGYFPLSLARPWLSAAANNILKYTSGTGTTGIVTVHGYEFTP